MIIGMGTAARGSDVRRLQDVLTSQGHAVDSAERDAQEFGPSTLAALQAFQARHGLGLTDKVDAATLEMLLRLERNLTGNGTTIPTNPPATDSSGGVVQGRLVDADGAPVAGMAITLVSKQIRTETRWAALVIGMCSDQAGACEAQARAEARQDLLDELNGRAMAIFYKVVAKGYVPEWPFVYEIAVHEKYVELGLDKTDEARRKLIGPQDPNKCSNAPPPLDWSAKTFDVNYYTPNTGPSMRAR
jgi:hypothetical protein